MKKLYCVFDVMLVPPSATLLTISQHSSRMAPKIDLTGDSPTKIPAPKRHQTGQGQEASSSFSSGTSSHTHARGRQGDGRALPRGNPSMPGSSHTQHQSSAFPPRRHSWAGGSSNAGSAAGEDAGAVLDSLLQRTDSFSALRGGTVNININFPAQFGRQQAADVPGSGHHSMPAASRGLRQRSQSAPRGPSRAIDVGSMSVGGFIAHIQTATDAVRRSSRILDDSDIGRYGGPVLDDTTPLGEVRLCQAAPRRGANCTCSGSCHSSLSVGQPFLGALFAVPTNAGKGFRAHSVLCCSAQCLDVVFDEARSRGWQPVPPDGGAASLRPTLACNITKDAFQSDDGLYDLGSSLTLPTDLSSSHAHAGRLEFLSGLSRMRASGAEPVAGDRHKYLPADCHVWADDVLARAGRL